MITTVSQRANPSAVSAQTPWPVVQIKQSHDLTLHSDDVGAEGALAVVPVFEVLQAGDRVKFVWQGFYQGNPEEEWSFTLTLDSVAIEHPLLMLIPKSEIRFIDVALVSFQRLPVGGGPAIDSPVQTLHIGPPATAHLASPEIQGHDSSRPITPGDFPDGVIVQFAAYPDIQAGDYLVLYATGEPDDGTLVMSQRVEQTQMQATALEFPIGPQWLQANQGAEVTLIYQFARPGAAKTSTPLTLNVIAPPDLPPPNVDRATPEGDADEHKGLLLASAATLGVYVDVPESVPLEAGDQLEVHWQGDPAGGQHIATAPADGQYPRRFRVPDTAIAANMGGENKRFPVFYRFTPFNGSSHDADPFLLRIQPMPQTSYPSVQLAKGGNTLSLQAVPSEGELLRLADWVFMAQEQLLTIEVTGVTAAGGAARIVVRNALPVTAAEVLAKQVLSRLSLSFLRTLKLDWPITLSAQVSFDGGKILTHLRPNTGVTVVA